MFFFITIKNCTTTLYYIIFLGGGEVVDGRERGQEEKTLKDKDSPKD
jgi:hypothetical protein